MIICKASKKVYYALIALLLCANYTWAQKTNLCGRVLYSMGNEMPSPDVPQRKGTGKQSILYVCALSTLPENHTTGSFFAKLPSKIIKKLKTATNGYFCTSLKKGNYSIFVQVEGGYFANLFDEKMNICPVIIETKKAKNLNIEVIPTPTKLNHEI